MSKKRVKGLLSATLVPAPLWAGGAPETKSQKDGLRFERKVGKALQALWGEAVILGPWIRYADEEGTFLCQPDAIILLPEVVLVIEVKLTFKKGALGKLKNLYGPVVGKITGRAPKLVQVCRNITRDFSGELTPLEEITVASGTLVTLWR